MSDDFRSADEQELTAGLRALAREDAAVQVPGELEARVMRAWDAARGPGSRRDFAARFVQVAAGVLLAVGTYWWAETRIHPTPPGMVGQRDAIAVNGPALPSDEVQAWLDLDPGPLQIVRVGVSRAALIAQGYAVNDPDGDGLVEIDVVVGADGVPRTVQLSATPFY
jgi:hypothetical protein